MDEPQGDLFPGENGISRSADARGHLGTDPAGGAPRPLAVRMRPRSFGEILGQEHILGEGALLPRLIKADTFGSILLYGPPGCGKTTLAEVIAQEARSRFIRLNAVLSNVAELRDILRFARSRPEDRTILFIDEIHRFNKAQQDLLLPDVEQGNIRLIGATTHNPGFYVIAPLVSRSQLFRLEPVGVSQVAEVLATALADKERGLGGREHTASEKVLGDLAQLCDGDMRRALNALETLALSLEPGAPIQEDDLMAFARERQIRYDSDEDEHYDTISVFIKSVRGCDPDAAIYWMVKMLEGGEDPRFIARRLVILASEDVGLADSRGLGVAVSTFQACEYVGLPECAYNLAHATIFLACCPKSNSAARALWGAQKEIREKPVQQVPPSLRDSHGKASKQSGHGKGYRYSHDYPENISGEDYLQRPVTFYEPAEVGAEAAIAERLAHWKELKAYVQRSHTSPATSG